MEWVPLDPSLGESCVELWNRSLGALFPMRLALLQQGLWEEPNFDQEASRAVTDGGRVIAFIAVKRHQVPLGAEPPANQAWLTALIVDPGWQGQGLGTRLLEHALESLRRHTAEPLSLGGDPGHFFPGVPWECRQALDWFARRGASFGGPPCDLLNPDVQAFAHPPKALEAFAREPGVVYRPSRPEERERVLAFMRAEFPGRWAYEMERHFAVGGRPEDVMLAVDGERIVGFARIHCPESLRLGPGTYWAPLFPGRHGGLGPIGVGAADRKRGLGVALLSAGIEELRNRGIQTAVIDWTVLYRFYGLVGFRPWKWYAGASLPMAGQA